MQAVFNEYDFFIDICGRICRIFDAIKIKPLNKLCAIGPKCQKRGHKAYIIYNINLASFYLNSLIKLHNNLDNLG